MGWILEIGLFVCLFGLFMAARFDSRHGRAFVRAAHVPLWLPEFPLAGLWVPSLSKHVS